MTIFYVAPCWDPLPGDLIYVRTVALRTGNPGITPDSYDPNGINNFCTHNYLSVRENSKFNNVSLCTILAITRFPFAACNLDYITVLTQDGTLAHVLDMCRDGVWYPDNPSRYVYKSIHLLRRVYGFFFNKKFDREYVKACADKAWDNYKDWAKLNCLSTWDSVMPIKAELDDIMPIKAELDDMIKDIRKFIKKDLTMKNFACGCARFVLSCYNEDK